MLAVADDADQFHYEDTFLGTLASLIPELLGVCSIGIWILS